MWWVTYLWAGYYLVCMALILLLWLTRQISHAGALELSDWFPTWRLREGTVLLRVAEWFTGGRVMGQAIGLNIIVRASTPELMRQVARHEECHCIQQLVLGPLFPVSYLLCSLCLKLFTHKHPYFDNPFEVQARRYVSRS